MADTSFRQLWQMSDEPRYGGGKCFYRQDCRRAQWIRFNITLCYMPFSSLSAHNMCSAVGEAWHNTAIGIHSDEISTVQVFELGYCPDGCLETFMGTKVVTIYTLLGTRLPPVALRYEDRTQNCSTVSGYVYFSDSPQNANAGGWEHDACHPVLALPPSSLEMRKAWEENGCQALDGYVAHDAPVALTQASSVV